MQVFPQALPFTQTLQHSSLGMHARPASATARTPRTAASDPAASDPAAFAPAQPGEHTPNNANPSNPATTRFRTKLGENMDQTSYHAAQIPFPNAPHNPQNPATNA